MRAPSKLDSNQWLPSYVNLGWYALPLCYQRMDSRPRRRDGYHFSYTYEAERASDRYTTHARDKLTLSIVPAPCDGKSGICQACKPPLDVFQFFVGTSSNQLTFTADTFFSQPCFYSAFWNGNSYALTYYCVQQYTFRSFPDATPSILLLRRPTVEVNVSFRGYYVSSSILVFYRSDQTLLFVVEEPRPLHWVRTSHRRHRRAVFYR